MSNHRIRCLLLVLIVFVATPVIISVAKAQTSVPRTVTPPPSPSPIPSPTPSATPSPTPSLEERVAIVESQVADLNKQTFISSVKDMADIGQAAATIIAAFVAGGWSLWLFKKYRRRYPRATIVHHITHRDIGNDKLLLHVNITISNVGDVLLSLISLETRIQQVLPLPDEVLDFINRGENPVPEGQTQIEWPLIDSQNLKLEKGECEIEPGESQEVHHDFILDAEVKTIEVYSYLVNEQKPDRELTWDVTTLYDLENTGEASSHPERSEPDGHRARANTETEEAKT